MFTLICAQKSNASSIKASEFGWDAEDATKAFQDAINSDADTVIIDLQSEDWIVGPSEFTMLKEKTIIFEPGVILRAKIGAFVNSDDCMLKLSGANNLKIIGYGATIQMNKAEYAVLKGEWRHGISLLDCTNIEIYGFYLNESGGDGIYVRGNENSENILLKDLWCDNHYRQGISIISAKNLVVRNCWFTNTSGTLPECGLDLEPNKNTDILVGILFDKCRFTNNYGNGTVLALGKLDSTSVPVDVNFTDCFYSGNHDVTNKYSGGDIRLGAARSGAVKGSVNFTRCMVENSQWGAVSIRKPANAYHATFDDCVFVNVSQDQTKTHNCPIWIEVTDYHKPCPRFGGVSFNNCLLSYSSDYPILGSFGNEPTSPGLGNVVLNNLQVIHPLANVEIDAASGGGSPDMTCNFDFHKQKSLPKTTVKLLSKGNLIESAGSNTVFQASRKPNKKLFPVGISYDIKGTAIQGEDISRLNGFLIIPIDSKKKKDKVLVLEDEIAEGSKSITLTPQGSTLYTIDSEPLRITVTD